MKKLFNAIILLLNNIVWGIWFAIERFSVFDVVISYHEKKFELGEQEGRSLVKRTRFTILFIPVISWEKEFQVIQ